MKRHKTNIWFQEIQVKPVDKFQVLQCMFSHQIKFCTISVSPDKKKPCLLSYSPHSYSILQACFLCIKSKLSWKLRTIHFEKLASRIKTSFGSSEGITNMHILPVVLCFTPHNCDAIMATMASQITSLAIVNSTVHSSADQRKHQGSTSLAFVRGIHRWPVNSLHKGPVTRKMFPFDYVIMHQPIYDPRFSRW